MAKNPFSGSINVSSLINIMQEVANGTKTVKSAEEELQAAYKKTLNEVKKLEKVQKELNETRSLNKQLSELKGNLTQIQNSLNKIATSSNDTTKGVKQFNNELEKTNKHLKNQAFATESWSYNWAKAMQSFLTYNTVTQFFNTVMNGIKDMIEQVKDLDSALVELQKVTDLEGKSLDEFVDKAYEAGETVAKTGTEMIEAATAFAKAGYKDNSLELGKIAAMYTNIADEAIDAADAADMIIAQMKAFNIEAEDSIHIIDAINEVSNNFAVSSADISRNLGKASAVMANAGNSMEQYIGLITAATEETRNASKAANGLKTITLRLQGMNDEGEKSLEVQAQMEGLFQKLGVSVYKSNGELKNTYEILETLAPIYKDLTNAEKAYVTETIAGKYQAQNAAAILNNWSTAVEATTTAMNSQGSAAKENEKVLNSIQGKLQQLNSAWEQLSRTIFDSDILKFVVDLGTKFLNLANSGLGKATVQLGVLLISFKLLPNLLNTIHTKLTLVTNGFVKNAAAIVTTNKITKNLTKETRNYIIQLLAEKGAINKSTGAIKTETLEKIKAKLASEGLTKAEQIEVLKTLTVASTYKAASKAAFTFKNAIKSLTAAIAANPIGAALLVVTGLTSGLQYLTGAAERAQEKFEKLQQEFKEAEEKLNSTNEELDKTNDRISELKAKGSLTFTEQEELDKLEKANIKLETQAKLYKEIADNKEKAAQAAANEAYNKDYNGAFNYKKITNSGKLEEMNWLDYINPVNIYNALSSNTANYGFDKNIIKDAVNLYDDLNTKRKEGIELTKQEKTQFDNLEISLSQELEELEEKIPNLTGEAKKEAQELRDYIVRFVFPVIFQEEQVNKFFGVDTKDEEAQKIKEKFKDIQKEMDELYKKGELTSKKIWELRKDQEGNWNELDKYMRDTGLSNDSIITYFDNIYKSADKATKAEEDVYEAAAKIRQAAGKSSNTDDWFISLVEGQNQVNLAYWQDFYEKLKNLADAGKLTTDTVYQLADSFGYLGSNIEEENLDSLAGILDYFSEDAQDTLSNYSKKIDDIKNQYQTLTSAVDEYNEAGYLTTETLKKIMDNNLLQYLSYENGQLVANTSEFYNNAESARIAASQLLANAMASDILYVASGNVDKVSGIAASAIESLGNNAEIAGNQAKNSTGNFITFAKAVDLTNKALAGKELTDDITKQIKAVEDAYKPYFDLVSKPINIEKKKYTSPSKSSSSSKSEKEWWEKELDSLKDQFNNSEITINQYINSLTNLLGKVQQGTDAWKKINQELQKQKLDKIKDDYNAGRISLNQYIISLQNLQKEYKKSTKEWNNLADAIKKAKLDKLKEQESDLKSALAAVNKVLDDQIDKYKKDKEAAIESIEKQIEEEEKLRDATQDRINNYEKAQQAVLKYLNEQLDSLNSNRDSVEEYYDSVTEAIEKMNEEQEDALSLAEAYENLVNAMSNKSKKVYKEGLGWVWEADQEAIKDAKKTYEDLLKDAQLKDIEDQKDKTLKTLDEQIKALEDYISSWEDVLNKFDNEKNKSLADLLLGENWTEAVSKLDLKVVTDFSNSYYNLQKTLEESEKKIEDLNNKKDETEDYWDNRIQKVEDYKNKWSEVTSTVEDEANKQKAAQILSANWEKNILNGRLDTLEKFKKDYNKITGEINNIEGMSTDDASGYTPYSLPGYANGGEVDYTGLAVLHGTPSRPEYVLNNTQMKNLLSNLTRPRVVSNINNGSSNAYNYNFGNIELPNVNNAQQFINELKSLVNTSKNL